MKLNHLNLAVTDVPAAHAFLAKHFRLRDGGVNSSIGFLYDDAGLVLSLTHMKVGGETEVRYPNTFHIGFIQEGEERVDEVNRELREAGIDVPLPSRQHGSWTFYFEAPGGITVEVLS